MNLDENTEKIYYDQLNLKGEERSPTKYQHKLRVAVQKMQTNGDNNQNEKNKASSRRERKKSSFQGKRRSKNNLANAESVSGRGDRRASHRKVNEVVEFVPRLAEKDDSEKSEDGYGSKKDSSGGEGFKKAVTRIIKQKQISKKESDEKFSSSSSYESESSIE